MRDRSVRRGDEAPPPSRRGGEPDATRVAGEAGGAGLDDDFGFDGDESWMGLLRDAESTEVRGTLGPYELIAEVSRGGQGIVYRGRDARSDRLVAVKRLAAGVFASASARHRFEREIEIVAGLNHPNIVRILNVAHVDGQPLLAMEWINGLPITAWAADGWERRRTLEERLRTFSRVCAAVHHAHQRGVIHRDLKPSNILVDGCGQPHVLDFGLAKPLPVPGEEPEGMTLSGQFLGTPAYASPELVRAGGAALDVRSDVYSLGVVLYEMLTGAMPYPVSGGLASVFRSIELVQPPRPSAVAPSLDRELDAILLKALAKEPDGRYQSVHGLGRDVERYLSGDPIEARSDHAFYVLRKTLRRYRAPVSLAAALVLLVAGFAATMSVMYRRAEREAGRARQVQRFVEEMLTSASPYHTEGEFDVMAMLERAAKRLDTELVGQPEAEAGVRHTIAQIYAGLWKWPEAEPHLRRALALYREVRGDHEAEVTACLTLLGRALTFQNEPEAIGVQQEALRRRRALYGETHPLVAETHANLGFAVWHTARPSRHETAEEHYRKSLLIYRRVQREPAHHFARTLYSFAAFSASQERLHDAEALYAESLEMYEALEGSGDVYMSECLADYALCLHKLGKYERGGAMLERAIAMRPAAVHDDRLATLHWELGTSCRYRGEHGRALSQYDRSLATTCRMLAKAKPERDGARAFRELALRLDDRERAERLYGEVYREFRASELVAPLRIVRQMLDVADALRGHGEPEAARELLVDSLRLAGSFLPPHHLKIADARCLLGVCLTDLGRFNEAEVHLRRAHRTLVRTHGPANAYTLATEQRLRHLYELWGRDGALEGDGAG